MFQINEVLELKEEKFRILSQFGNDFVWISIDNKNAFPAFIDSYSLEQAIKDEALCRVEDPYAYILMASPQKNSIAQLKRDSNYKLIYPIIECDEYYQPKQRAKAVNLVMSKYNKHFIDLFANIGKEDKQSMLYCLIIKTRGLKVRNESLGIKS